MLPFLSWDIVEGKQVDFCEDPWILPIPLSNLETLQNIKAFLPDHWDPKFKIIDPKG